jgi:hypothetical protein
MTVAIELAIVPLAELIQDFFGLVGPVLGIAIAGSIAFLFLRTSLRWFKIL